MFLYRTHKKISLTGNKYNKSEKFDIIVSYYSLEEGLKGSFLREKGLFLREIENWKGYQ
jgi:hypothetical protein